MERTLSLIQLAHQGDKMARNTLVEENMGLVYHIVQRFKNRGVEMEDLIQIGSIGLIKSIDKFRPEFQVKLSTYAVPMIVGEIKRFLRDDGMIKVSRNLKEMSVRIYLVREVLENRLQREPNVEEIALEMGVEMEDVVLALDAGTEIESLQKVIYQGENNEITLMDKIPKALGEEELILDRLWLTQVLGLLKKEERALLYKRYFQNKTQSKIAQEMGISQVQVSRMEKKILIFLRGKL